LALGAVSIGVLLIAALATMLELSNDEVSRSPDSTVIAIPTSALKDGMACHGALLEATLISHPELGVAADLPDGPLPIFWPSGFSGRAEGQEVAILNPHGEVVARTGDRIRAGGGGTTIDGVRGFEMCPEGPTVLVEP
jgi:hypothetical protein